jgi:hypothetical protein
MVNLSLISQSNKKGVIEAQVSGQNNKYCSANTIMNLEFMRMKRNGKDSSLNQKLTNRVGQYSLAFSLLIQSEVFPFSSTKQNKKQQKIIRVQTAKLRSSLFFEPTSI